MFKKLKKRENNCIKKMNLRSSNNRRAVQNKTENLYSKCIQKYDWALEIQSQPYIDISLI